MTEYLNFLSTTIQFEVAAGAEQDFSPIRRFFRGLMSPTAVSRPTFVVTISPYDPSSVPADVWSGEQTIIRRSTAAEFCFTAHVLDHGDRRRYINRSTILDVPRDALRDGTFEIQLSGGSKVQVIDFVRDLVIRHQEQLGTVVLHASGIEDGTRAIAIAGPKGAGKTTTMLSALQRPNWQYFTGDKMFCESVEDGTIRMHPWRDYPYVGVGTILAHPRLTELVCDLVDPAVAQRPVTDKLLLDPDVFESWLGVRYSAAPKPLAALFLPEVRPGQPLDVRLLTEDNERWAYLNKLVDRQADTTFFTWQSYLVPDYAAFYETLSRLRYQLADIPMVRLTGTLDVDPDQVLLEGTRMRAGVGGV